MEQPRRGRPPIKFVHFYKGERGVKDIKVAEERLDSDEPGAAM